MAYGFDLQKAGNQRNVGQGPVRLPSYRPVETCTEGLAYERPICGMVAAESGMNFGQDLLPFLFEDAPLEHSGRAFLIKLSLMDLVGFRAPHNATCLILVLREFLPI